MGGGGGGVMTGTLLEGHRVRFTIYTRYRVFFQETMCYLPDYLFRVCDVEKHYKLPVLSKNSIFIENH